VKPATAENYRWVVRSYIAPSIGRVQLAKLTPGDVDRMLRALEARGLSANTRRLARSVLRRALVFAERRGEVARNAAGLAEAVHVERRPHRVLTVTQARRLLDVARDDRLEALWTLALLTGLREGELLGLRWEDVDLERGELHVRGTLKRLAGQGLVRTSPKNRASGAGVPLVDLAVDALGRHGARQVEERLAAGEHWRDEGYVFTTPLGGPLDARNLLRSWHALRERAGLPEMTVHDLRHTAATLLRNLGVPMDVVSRILRHSGISITADIYAEVGHDLAREAVEVLGRALREPESAT
jgi:integrase